MKFVKAAIAFVAAAVAGADAAKPRTKQEWKRTLDHRMKNGLFDQATIMKNAKPYSEAAKNTEFQRKLGGMEITGSFSIQFQSCFSFTTSYEDIFENEEDGGMKMVLFQNGDLQPLRSYAIFRLCYNNVCNANGNEALLEYVVDLDTYVQALVSYLPSKMEEFCEGCEENADSCLAILYGGYAGAYQNGGQYRYQNYNANDNNYNGNNANQVNYEYGQYGYGANGNNGQQAQQQQQQNYNYNNGEQAQQAYYNNGNNRKLAELHDFEKRVLQEGQVVKQLDCSLCQEYGCLGGDDNNNGDIYGFEAASEWLQEMAECKETEINYYGSSNAYYGQNQGDDNQLFAGFVCNQDGNGVEIGLFLDEECILYLTNESYQNYMNYFDQTYAQMTKEVIEFTFSDAIFSCKDEEVVYTTQDLGGYNMYNYQNWNGNDDDVAEWCELLAGGGESTPVDVSSCGRANGQYYQNQQNQGQNNQYQNQDQAMQYMYTYSWYRYEIDLDYSLDMYTVCEAIKNQQGSLHTFYNSNNGNLYYYGNSQQASDSITEFMEDTGEEITFVEKQYSLSGGAKFGIVAATGIVVGAAVAMYLRSRSSAEDSKEFALMEGEQKGEAA